MDLTAPRSTDAWRIGIPVLIGIGYFVLTFNPHYRPFLFDEALFLTAMQDGRPAFFPGYLGFLSAARAFWAVCTPAASLNLMSSLFGSASVVVFWFWMRRLKVPAFLAAAGTLAFATGVYQLYNSSVGVTYEVEAFAFLLTGYLCESADRKHLYYAAPVLAFCGAFRQTTPMFLMPLFLWCCYRAKDAKPALLFGAFSLLWLIPTVVAFGGAPIVSAGSTQVVYAVLPSTLFHGFRFAAVNLLRFMIFIIYGAHVLLVFALRNLTRFALVWIGPGAAFFGFAYIAWPGYALGVLAVLILLGVKYVCQFRRGVALTILLTVSALNCIQFFAVRPIEQPSSFTKAVSTAYAFQYSKAAINSGFQRRLQDFAVVSDFTALQNK
jgi:hypothetical protein